MGILNPPSFLFPDYNNVPLKPLSPVTVAIVYTLGNAYGFLTKERYIAFSSETFPKVSAVATVT